MTDFKRRRSVPASTPEADYTFSSDAPLTRPYVPSEQPFSSAAPADPDAQPVFTNEEAWLPDFDAAEAQSVPFGDGAYGDAADAENDSGDMSFDEDTLGYAPEDGFDEMLLTDEELHQTRWTLLAGLWDFLSVIVGAGVILVLVAMLFSLLNWLVSNVTETISLFQTGL